jgi:peptidoglycan/xylan/chitin deacetylase (PgdA/CDA1 family)
MFPAIAASACVGSGFLAWAVRGRSASVFGRSIWRGDPSRRAVALTFDDGPSESTPEILGILERLKAPATFFQCGANVERLPEIARAVRDAGHEIGNHSYSHPLLCFRTGRFIEGDLRRAQGIIAERTGATPIWFRAPFGARWFGLRDVQQRLGLTGVMWTVIGHDWNRTADAVVRHFTRRVSPGGILCLHDGRELRQKPDVRATVQAVARIVPMLLDQGYKLETVSELMKVTSSRP